MVNVEKNSSKAGRSSASETCRRHSSFWRSMASGDHQVSIADIFEAPRSIVLQVGILAIDEDIDAV